MSKLLESTLSNGRQDLLFWCPGCKIYHRFTIANGNNSGPVWSWNSSMDKPTFNPSLRTMIGNDYQCHLFVRDGMIQFLGDCNHELRGQTVEMEEP